MPESDEMIGTAEAARMLGVDKTTMTRRAAEGRPEPVVKLPGRNGAFLFRRADVEAQRVAAAAQQI